MIVRIGTMFMGEVDAVGSQSVQTKFFILGVPLFPVGSYFFTAPGHGVEIPLHGKSVAAGYLRMALGLAALLLGIFALVKPSYRRDPSDWAGAALAAAGFVASLFVLGRLSADEKSRRSVLAARTGLAADPAILPDHLRRDILGEIRSRLEARELPTSADAWLTRATNKGASTPYREADAADVAGDVWEDVYAYARYAAADDDAWRAALEPIWARVSAA